MRLRRNRLTEYKHCRMDQKKDKEGGTCTEYGPPSSFYAEMWAASGKLQSEMYGSRKKNIRNLRLEGTYREVPGKVGKVSYEITDGTKITVNDGICISGDTPDYKVVAIYPYRFLTLDGKKI